MSEGTIIGAPISGVSSGAAPAGTEPLSLAEVKLYLRLNSATLADNWTLTQSIVTGDYNAGSSNGASVDISGYQAQAAIQVGNVGSGASLVVKIQESDDGITWVDISGATTPSIISAIDDRAYEINFTPIRRYVRAVGTVSAGTAVYGVAILKKSPPTAEDELLNLLISSCRENAESFCRRAFISQSREERFEGFPSCDYIVLSRPPLISVTSFVYLDSSEVQHTLTENTDFLVDKYSEPGRLVLPYGDAWPTTTLSTNMPVRITYVCGYGVNGSYVPKAIRNAILLEIADRYEHRENTMIGQGLINTKAAERLLWPYRAW